jgi:hypothetical protein
LVLTCSVVSSIVAQHVSLGDWNRRSPLVFRRFDEEETWAPMGSTWSPAAAYVATTLLGTKVNDLLATGASYANNCRQQLDKLTI